MSASTSSVYEDGPFSVSLFEIAADAPKPLLIAAPSSSRDENAYPLIFLQHGFALQNRFYSQLMRHLASHGFIVVAPQMYKHVAGPDAREEIAQAAATIEWIADGNLSSYTAPDLEKFAVIGHSRGGKVAFALALARPSLALKFGALIALDPVDGTSNGNQTTPPILRFQADCLDIGCPALILGAGLGCERRNFLTPPCAPERVGHRAFFFDCCAPAFLFRAPSYGHMDFLDDDTRDCIAGRLTYAVCKNGASRAPMRRLAGGLAIAFLQKVFFRCAAAFQDAIDHPSPLVEKPQSKERQRALIQNP